MIQNITEGVHLISDTDTIYLLADKRLFDPHVDITEYSLFANENVRLIETHTLDCNRFYLFHNQRCAVAFKELSYLPAVSGYILSQENLDNTLYQCFPKYTKEYNQTKGIDHPIQKSELWADHYLPIHTQQQAAIEQDIEKCPLPYHILTAIPYQSALTHFRYICRHLSVECVNMLENLDNNDTFFLILLFPKLPERIYKKRVWLSRMLTLELIKRKFHIALQPTPETTNEGKIIFQRLLEEGKPLLQAKGSFSTNEYDYIPIPQLYDRIQNQIEDFLNLD